jgi:hypothetical protein
MRAYTEPSSHSIACSPHKFLCPLATALVMTLAIWLWDWRKLAASGVEMFTITRFGSTPRQPHDGFIFALSNGRPFYHTNGRQSARLLSQTWRQQ